MKILKIIIGILISLLFIAAAFFVYTLYINPKSPLDYSELVVGNKEITIRYYRPYKNERLIFGEADQGALVPYGKYWRLGANLTTKLTTNKELNFAGQALAQGSYGLYVYPNADYWTVYVHTKTGGYSFEEPDPSGIVLKSKVAVTTLEDVVEQFTIDFVGSSIRMRWDTTEVIIPIM